MSDNRWLPASVFMRSIERGQSVSPIAISCAVFACVLGGMLLGMLFGRSLPVSHLNDESKNAVKMGLTLIATLTALVLGLLVASAKGTYDTQNSAVKQLSANVILLDRALARYGSETKELRELLRRAFTLTLHRIWPDDGAGEADLTPGEARAEIELFYDQLAALSPENDAQRALKARALDITADLAQARLRMFSQRDSSIPLPFLLVVAVWLMVLFIGYGLLSPRNLTVFTVLLVCALSVAGALFLILELDRPFAGVLRIPSAPLHEALARVGQ
jgi:hypothetical protein